MSSSGLIRTSVTIDPGDLSANLGSLAQRFIVALRGLGQMMAQRMRSWAQANAPWTDRTGDARQRLMTRVRMEGAKLVIILFHQMTYGIWLEVKHNGRWAIIMKTIDRFYPEVMRLAVRLVMGT